MHFLNDGLTHSDDTRCFRFRSIEAHNPVAIFTIKIDLQLLTDYRIPVQEGPMFCLQLLTNALAAGPDDLGRLHSYSVAAADFRPLLVERERKTAENAMKKY